MVSSDPLSTARLAETKRISMPPEIAPNNTSKDRRRIVVVVAFAVLLVGCLIAIMATEE
jgi:hypothetical protein